MSRDKPTRVDRIKTAAFNRPIVALLFVIGSTLLFSKAILEAGVEMLELFGIRQSRELLLARDNDRGVLLREVNQLCYRRIFWANSFVGRVARNAPQRDRDLAWDRYMDSVENWSASLVINQAQLEALFSATKRQEFTDDIDSKFKETHAELLAIRYPADGGTPVDFQQVFARIDAINVGVFVFVTGLQSGEANNWGVKVADVPLR